MLMHFDRITIQRLALSSLCVFWLSILPKCHHSLVSGITIHIYVHKFYVPSRFSVAWTSISWGQYCWPLTAASVWTYFEVHLLGQSSATLERLLQQTKQPITFIPIFMLKLCAAACLLPQGMNVEIIFWVYTERQMVHFWRPKKESVTNCNNIRPIFQN